jgi:hypothetical protein
MTPCPQFPLNKKGDRKVAQLFLPLIDRGHPIRYLLGGYCTLSTFPMALVAIYKRPQWCTGAIYKPGPPLKLAQVLFNVVIGFLDSSDLLGVLI